MRVMMPPVHRQAIFAGTKDSCLARALQCARCRILEIMTGRIQHHFRRSGTCFTQGQQRGAASRPVVVSVWDKKTGAGNQN
jgi:hypothetical protein